MDAALNVGTSKARAAGLYTVIAFKFGKALLLMGLGLGIFSLLGEDLRGQFERLLRFFRQDPEQEFWMAVAAQLQHITPTSIGWIASSTLLYSLLLFTESIGLMRRAGWAVWVAIGETAFFIPIEVFQLLRHPRTEVVVILVVNICVVWYLAVNRHRLFRHHHAHSTVAALPKCPKT